ncbi:3-oxoacyl-[acyl-carrier-protein] synthase 2 [Abditibacteriota bacterium]|nr:3-oxoacyl-[acyl-carrier-protein] synthase 2 [Abditibacteriota bacterium]
MHYDELWLTGMGTVCPLGLNVETFWRRLIGSESGIGPLTKVDASGLRNARGGQINGFDMSLYVEEGDCDEASAFAFAAANEAAQNAGLNDDDKARCGLAFGTNFGGAASWEMVCELAREGESDPETFAQFLPDQAATYLASRWDNSGPRATISNACSSGAHAIGLAANWLRLGRCELAVAGGFDGLGLSTLAGLSILRTISPDEIRPFDVRRNGTIFGEGAAFVVLETKASAQRRGANPLARLCGWNVGANAHHLTAPDKGGAGLGWAMQQALKNAAWNPDSVGYLNAHGTGTQYNDLAETEATQTVFGDSANTLAISSIKAATSHTMGAAGALEAIATVMALREGILPPTLNLDEPDPALTLDYIPLKAREKAITRALSNSSGIGGNNASLALERIG